MKKAVAVLLAAAVIILGYKILTGNGNGSDACNLGGAALGAIVAAREHQSASHIVASAGLPIACRTTVDGLLTKPPN